MRTSIGIHTITGFKTLSGESVRSLLRDFQRYSRAIGTIKIHTIDESKMTYKIYFPSNDIGITWRINFITNRESFKYYSIEATINPKILTGITDFITAANEEDIQIAIRNYDREVKEISKLLGSFTTYTLNRIDYCINFYLPELGITCTPEQMMELIKRGNIPKHYLIYMKYDDTSHRMKPPLDSIYYKSNHVTINSYLKYHQLLKEYPDNPSLQDAQGIIRFEVQCKYHKIYNMAKKRYLSDADTKAILLSDDFAREIISNYYDRVVMSGDYGTLSDVIRYIEKQSYRGNKGERMIAALKDINESRGISKARTRISNPDSIVSFNQALRELSKEGINPVTIPREWGVRHIPNLLDTYDKMRGEELIRKSNAMIEI